MGPRFTTGFAVVRERRQYVQPVWPHRVHSSPVGDDSPATNLKGLERSEFRALSVSVQGSDPATAARTASQGLYSRFGACRYWGSGRAADSGDAPDGLFKVPTDGGPPVRITEGEGLKPVGSGVDGVLRAPSRSARRLVTLASPTAWRLATYWRR